MTKTSSAPITFCVVNYNGADFIGETLAPTDPSVPDEQDVERWRAYWARLIRFEVPADRDRFLDGLRKAGLPA